MTLLDFARGPGMDFALAVFVLGTIWRIMGIGLLQYRVSHAAPGASWLQAVAGAVVTSGSRSWPHKAFIGRTGYGELIGYGFHIGLLTVILGFAPHIEFFKGLFNISWASLPTAWINVASVITLTLLVAVLVRRLTHPVLRRLSNFDDYFSWFLVAAVVTTGLMAAGHAFAPYELVLALHLLSLEALLIWFPFGKLMHMFFIFPSRSITGFVLGRKGAPS